MIFSEKQRTKEDRLQALDSDAALADLYKSGRRWLYMGLAVLGIGLLLFLCFIYPLHNISEDRGNTMDVAKRDYDGDSDSGSTGAGSDGTGLTVVTDQGIFLSAHEVYTGLKDNILSFTGYEYMTSVDGEGGLGFYKKGHASYSFSIACLDKNHEYLEVGEQEIPDRVLLYDKAEGEARQEHMACFIRSFFDDLSYEEALGCLREQSMPEVANTKSPVIPIVVRDSVFYLFSTGQGKQYALAVTWDSLDYARNQNAYTALHRMGLDGSSDRLISHKCIVCGKKASYRLKWVNKTWEWYCREHWDEMEERREVKAGR